MASYPPYIKKYLRMKPEVNQIFEELEAFRSFVVMQYPFIKFDPADLNKNSSPVWQRYMRHQRALARRTEGK